jgi:CBS domain containing-hemolysin-like protein
VETLAGFLLAQLGHIPQPNESVAYEERRYTVVEMSGRRISRVRVEPLDSTAIAAPAEERETRLIGSASA